MSVPFYNLLFNLQLDEAATEPIYLQLANRVAEVIHSGKLQPGAPMPGTRTIAKALKISRNAAIAAYGELNDQGWIQTEVGFGTRVSLVLPDFISGVERPSGSRHGTAGFEILSALKGSTALAPPTRVDMREMCPDPRLCPEDELARAFRRSISKAFGHPRGTRDPLGSPLARQCLAGLLAERRAMDVDSASILLTGGTQDALGLIARNLFPPGSAIAVEEPGNPRAWAAFQLAGLELVPVPVDGEGLCPEALEDVCVSHRPRALYLTANCQWPTGAILSRERRSAVLEIAGQYRMAILEDDHATELYYEERDWRPLISEDRRGVVLHIGTFENLFGPAFGLGYIVGPEEALTTLACARNEEGGSDLDLLGGAMRDLVLDGTFLRHVRKARTAYRGRRDLVLEFLGETFPGSTAFSSPASGLGVWVHSAGFDLAEWHQRAEGLGISFRSPSHWCLGPEGKEGLLLPFGRMGDAELAKTLSLLKRIGTKQHAPA